MSGRLARVCGVGVLFYYKYADFIGKTYADAVGKDYTARKLILPLGLSFFVFKAISYLIDIYKGKIEAYRNPIYAIDYLSFFGQMESGPLSRYADMADSLLMSASDAKTGRQIAECYILPGMESFAASLIKKTLLSNVLYNIVSEVFSTSASQTTPAFLWLGSICYSLQLFFDFSDILIWR